VHTGIRIANNLLCFSSILQKAAQLYVRTLDMVSKDRHSVSAYKACSSALIRAPIFLIPMYFCLKSICRGFPILFGLLRSIVANRATVFSAIPTFSISLIAPGSNPTLKRDWREAASPLATR